MKEDIKSFDFSKAKKNPYTKKLKSQISLRVNNLAIKYFKELAEKTGVPYQNLIDMYLLDCAINKKQPRTKWE